MGFLLTDYYTGKACLFLAFSISVLRYPIMFYEYNVVVYGHGAGAVVLASRLNHILQASKANVTVLQPRNNAITQDTAVQWPDGSRTVLQISQLAYDPATCIPNAHVIIFCHPTPKYNDFLSSIAPYVEDQLQMILAVPGACGFDWMVKQAFSQINLNTLKVAAVESLPFIARKNDDSFQISVLSMKNKLHIGANQQLSTLWRYQITYLLGPELIDVKSLLAVSLLNQNAKLHPVMMMVHFDHSNTKPNCFYDIGDKGIEIIDRMEHELQYVVDELAKALKIQFPYFQTLKAWYESCYKGRGVEDVTKGLRHSLASNKVLSSLDVPLIVNNKGQCTPNFRHRYLTEDIPYGLLIYKGLAELVNVNVPMIDSLIIWSQAKLNKRYIDIKTHTLDTDALQSSGVPQRYGINSIEDLKTNMDII